MSRVSRGARGSRQVVSYWQSSEFFKLRLKLSSEGDCLTESGMSSFLGAQ